MVLSRSPTVIFCLAIYVRVSGPLSTQMLVATSSALLMGLGTWIKRIYYGGPNPQHWEYDLKRRALRKIIHPRTSSKKRLQKSQNLLDSGDSLVVTIWYRPLEDAVMRSVSWKTTGHWCIQVKWPNFSNPFDQFGLKGDCTTAFTRSVPNTTNF